MPLDGRSNPILDKIPNLNQIDHLNFFFFFFWASKFHNEILGNTEGDFPDGRTTPSNVGYSGLVHGQGTKIPHAPGQFNSRVHFAGGFFTTSATGEAVQFQGLLLIIPGTNWYLYQFTCKNAAHVLQCCLFHLVSHRISLDPTVLARPSGLKNSEIQPLSLSKVWPNLLCLQAGAESRQHPGRSEAGQWPALLLLKPEQDFLHFNFPNTTPEKNVSLKQEFQRL